MIDGIDLTTTLLEGKPSERNVYFFYRGERLFAVRKGPYKAHFFTQSGYGPGPAKKHDPPLLFHLGIDPGESYDIAKQHPEIVADLLREAAKHLARKRARETESDEIRTAFALQVRQMVARMETRSQMTLRVGCRAGILPAGCSGFQPRVFLRWFHCLRNFGQDARKTGRLEACPTFLRREHSPFCLTQNGVGFAEEFERIQPARLRNSGIRKICELSRPSLPARAHLQPLKRISDLHRPVHAGAFLGYPAQNRWEQRQINRSFRDDADAGAHGFAPAVAPSRPLTHASPSECSNVSRTIFNLP